MAPSTGYSQLVDKKFHAAKLTAINHPVVLPYALYHSFFSPRDKSICIQSGPELHICNVSATIYHRMLGVLSSALVAGAKQNIVHSSHRIRRLGMCQVGTAQRVWNPVRTGLDSNPTLLQSALPCSPTPRKILTICLNPAYLQTYNNYIRSFPSSTPDFYLW